MIPPEQAFQFLILGSLIMAHLEYLFSKLGQKLSFFNTQILGAESLLNFSNELQNFKICFLVMFDPRQIFVDQVHQQIKEGNHVILAAATIKVELACARE